VAGTVNWTISGTSGDGTTVIVEVTATLNPDGSITVNYGLAANSAPADINGVFFDFFNDGGSVKSVGANSNNMKGYGDGFDHAVETGKAGLGTDGEHTSGTVVFTAAQLKDIFGDLEGDSLLEAFAETEIGIRATSTGDDREGSLKIGAVGEFVPEDDCTDHFPDLERDISYVNFVFELNEGETSDLDRNGDGYVTVKVEMPEVYVATDCSNDLDSWYKEALSAIYEAYPGLDDISTEVGAFIKGGNDLFSGENVWSHGSDNNIAYFSFDDDPGNDPLPEGFKTDADGNIVATGQPANRYDDGNAISFDPAWVPDECDCVA
jgi:hypothetical protein